MKNKLRQIQSYPLSHFDTAPLSGPDDRPERGERAVANPPSEGRVDGSQGNENLAGPAMTIP